MKNRDLDSEEADRRNMRHAVCSACWGAIPQVMVRDSSLFIVFASLIGAGEMASVMTTALSDISLCLLMLPFAALSDRVGVKRQIAGAVFVSVLALLLAATAPWLGKGAGSLLLVSLGIFAVSISAYLAAWFPMLERVVSPLERGLFFGRLRFSWQVVATLFIAASGTFVGRFASVSRLQGIIVLAALASLGRVFHIARIQLPAQRVPSLRFRESLLDALGNKTLTGFGAYLFFLYLSANATAPVVFVFARNHLGMADGLVVLLSAASLGGLIAGFPLGGWLVQRYGAKGMLLTAHVGFAVLNFALLAIRDATPLAAVALGLVLAAYGMLFAGASVAVSSELLALASPVNKAVSIALGYSLYAAGMGGSRMLASLTLGSGILAESWHVGGLVFSRYHSLFLAFGCCVIISMLLLVQVPGFVRKVERLPST